MAKSDRVWPSLTGRFKIPTVTSRRPSMYYLKEGVYTSDSAIA